MDTGFFSEIVLILGLSALVVLIFQKIKLPSIIGFLLTGTLVGPHGMGLLHSVHEVEMLSEIGVIFLLFTIGIEFSFAHLFEIKRSVLLGGTAQVGLTLLGVTFGLKLLQQPLSLSVFAGCMVALSSTAIVLKLMQQRQEMDSPQGKTVLGVLIFQDIVIVPMMLLVPLMAGKAESPGMALGLMLLKFIGVALAVLIASRWIMPKLLYQVARTRNNELFLLAILAICMVVAWLTASIGLSLSLGAFLAGLIISESEYSHQAMSNILPFRDVFLSFFFVSIGMLLDGGFFVQHWPSILTLTGGVILLKIITGALAAGVLGYPLRIAWLTGFALAQVGEFAFVLSKAGLDYGLLQEHTYQLFLAVSIVTMALTPLLIRIGPRTAYQMTRLSRRSPRATARLRPLAAEAEASDKAKAAIENHLVIIGFGFNGQNLAKAAHASGIPYVIVETNAETVKRFQAQGEPIYFGDAAQPVILEHLQIVRARVAVIAISDPRATQQVLRALRQLNPTLHLIVRTRFVHEVAALYQLGANVVIPEEFETAIEIFSRVLQHYLVPAEDIEHFAESVRSGGYHFLRGPSSLDQDVLKLPMADFAIQTFRLEPDSELIDQTLGESALRQRLGGTLLAIRRGTELLTNPDIQTRFQVQDVLILLGSPQQLHKRATIPQPATDDDPLSRGVP